MQRQRSASTPTSGCARSSGLALGIVTNGQQRGHQLRRAHLFKSCRTPPVSPLASRRRKQGRKQRQVEVCSQGKDTLGVALPACVCAARRGHSRGGSGGHGPAKPRHMSPRPHGTARRCARKTHAQARRAWHCERAHLTSTLMPRSSHPRALPTRRRRQGHQRRRESGQTRRTTCVPPGARLPGAPCTMGHALRSLERARGGRARAERTSARARHIRTPRVPAEHAHASRRTGGRLSRPWHAATPRTRTTPRVPRLRPCAGHEPGAAHQSKKNGALRGGGVFEPACLAIRVCLHPSNARARAPGAHAAARTGHLGGGCGARARRRRGRLVPRGC